MDESGKHQKVSMKTIGSILKHKINPSSGGTDNSLLLNSSGTLLNSSRDESMSSQSGTTKRTKVKVRQRSGRGTTGPVNVFDQFGQSEMAHDNSLPTLPSTLVVVEEATLSSPYGE
jgi:hypothetical protein